MGRHAQANMPSLLASEKRVPAKHPLRAVKELAEAALKELSPLYDAMYWTLGRSSILPKRLLRASQLIAFYTVRGERVFCQQLD